MSEQLAEPVVTTRACPPTCPGRLLTPDVTRTLARCEYTQVLGLKDVVDVRMPAATWERLRAAARGERA